MSYSTLLLESKRFHTLTSKAQKVNTPTVFFRVFRSSTE